MAESTPEDVPVRLRPNGMLSVDHTPVHLLHLTEQNAKSRLLSLPVEIRNQIYGYVFAPRDPTRAYEFRECHIEPFGMLRVSLLQVCRKTYAETNVWIFANNTIKTELNNLVWLWNSNSFVHSHPLLLPGQRNAIRSVHVCRQLLATFIYCLNPMTDASPVGERVPSVGKDGTFLTDLFPNLQRIELRPVYHSDRLDRHIKHRGCTSEGEYLRLQESKPDLEVVRAANL